MGDERFCAICWRKRPVEELSKDDRATGTWWRCRDEERCAAVAREQQEADRVARARRMQSPA